jgi:APA family basic amino acid/polyamine antiporter
VTSTVGRSPDAEPRLRRTIGRFEFFALAFGTIIGSAWVVVLGDWLKIAGPGGTLLAFLAGGALMTLVAAVYAELSARMPEAGGEFIYAYRVFGPRLGFIVGWFVTLFLLAVTAFEAIALPWMLQTLFPELRGPVLYRLLGHDVTLDAVLIGVSGVVLISFLNYRDVRLAVTFQSVITYGFLAVALLVLAAAAGSGDVTNLRPLFDVPGERAWWLGALWIFANTAFFLNGFQAIPQAIEEGAVGVTSTSIAKIMMLSVAVAALFYCVVVLCTSIAVPWRTLAGSSLATATAVDNVLPDRLLARVVLLAAALSLLKTWNAIALMAARILMSQARFALVPQSFGRIHPRFSTPSTAVLFVGLCSLGGVFLGRGAIVPLVNMASICLAFTFVLACVELLMLRRQETSQAPGFRVPGGRAPILIGVFATVGMSLVALFEPLSRTAGAIPLEWMLMIGWGGLGMLLHVAWKLRGQAQYTPTTIGREQA